MTDFKELVFKSIDQSLTAQEFEQLQDALESSQDLRSEYLRIISISETLEEIGSEAQIEDAKSARDSKSPSFMPKSSLTENSISNSQRFVQIALAASILFAVAGSAFWIGQLNRNAKPTNETAQLIDSTTETHVAGHAILRRSINIAWLEETPQYRSGDILPNGSLRFNSGIAEIDFFCGATLIVEGPAELDIESDWSVQVTHGRLRANVPPAARGFVVRAAGSDIVDLGTEFALEASGENARVEVVDGEIAIRGGQHDGNHLVTGQRQWLKGTENAKALEGLSTPSELTRLQNSASRQQFTAWQTHSRELQNDRRLVAYFPIADSEAGASSAAANEHFDSRVVQNRSPRGALLNGKILGAVERTTGRFGSLSNGLKFHRLGARVRTRIDGVWDALTLACWVRIDSLDHRYNALFMADGFENGEPHWQIRNDGRLLITVMVDDTREIKHFSELEGQMVTDAGLHKNYYSEPFWDLSKSGQWFHLVATYDPSEKRVRQFVNGLNVCDQPISEELLARKLKIGPAEIGNWGQPFRDTPQFAIRNLDGTIDELAIFDTALSNEEIQALFNHGKPLGY